MSNAYYRVGLYYLDITDPDNPVSWRCKTAGDKTSSEWSKVVGGGGSGGATVQNFQIVSDGGDYWVARSFIAGTPGTVNYNILKPYDIRAGVDGMVSQTVNGVTYTYTYIAILDSSTSSITISYKRKVNGSDGSVVYDYLVPPPFGSDTTVDVSSNPVIMAVKMSQTDVAAPDTVIKAVLHDAGTGYVVNDIWIVAGGTGTAAKIKVLSIGTGGAISDYEITDSGSYTVDPPLVANAGGGGSGSGATFDLTMSGAWQDLNIGGRAWAYSQYG